MKNNEDILYKSPRSALREAVERTWRVYHAVIEVMCWRYQAFLQYIYKPPKEQKNILVDNNGRVLAEVEIVFAELWPPRIRPSENISARVQWRDVGTVRPIDRPRSVDQPS